MIYLGSKYKICPRCGASVTLEHIKLEDGEVQMCELEKDALLFSDGDKECDCPFCGATFVIWDAEWDRYSPTVKHIPYGITEIGSGAFRNCCNLAEVHIPPTVVVIGGSAFHSCYSLKAIIIPDSVLYIGDRAFVFCSALEKVTLPKSIVVINEYTFDECRALSEVNIPDSVTEIDLCAFCGCLSLESIHIPDRVEHIGSCAFSECENLINISIPESTTIANSAFACPFDKGPKFYSSRSLDGTTDMRSLPKYTPPKPRVYEKYDYGDNDFSCWSDYYYVFWVIAAVFIIFRVVISCS